MIDHARAFRTGRNLLKPDQLTRIERSFFENLKKLTPASVAEAVDASLIKQEIDALIARRGVMVKLFEGRIAERGEPAVLYTLPQWSAGFSQRDLRYGAGGSAPSGCRSFS